MKWRWVITEACPLRSSGSLGWGWGRSRKRGGLAAHGGVERQEGQAHLASLDGDTSQLLPRRLCSSLNPCLYSTNPAPTVRCSLGARILEDPRCDASKQPSSIITVPCLGACRLSPGSAASLALLQCRQTWAGGCGPHPVIPR